MRRELSAVREHKALLLGLLLIDLAMVALHTVHKAKNIEALSLFSLSGEFAAPECFQYFKWLAIALMLALVWRLRRTGLYLFWSAAFVFLAVDDAFALHEALGRWFSELLALQAVTDALRGEDLGEAMAAALFAGVLLVGGAVMHLRAGVLARSRAWALYLLLVLLGVFGVVIDILHSAIWMRWHIRGGVAIEEGGEMAIASILVVFAYGLYMRDRLTIPSHAVPAGAIRASTA